MFEIRLCVLPIFFPWSQATDTIRDHWCNWWFSIDCIYLL